MAIELATQFQPYVDEKFTTEAKKTLVTNRDYDWTGAHSIKVYKIGTSAMTDYDRSGTGAGKNGSRYGEVASLDASTEEMTLKKDRSFTFAIDKLDTDETKRTLQAAEALERQIREVVIPEIDTYVFNEMVKGAGHKATPEALTDKNIYEKIILGNAALDNAEVPEAGRALIVTPDVYLLMKKNPDIVLNTDIGQDMRVRGVIANLDGANVIKVPANRLPEKFGFLLCHSVATVSPQKLEDYKVHEDPPGISGSLVEGRICYDAFVLDNKKKAIYYQALK